ncbi:ankyrin-3 [Nephila pilipes]|uniref:Ankyrin-3 n=1 Tax=Nephila pilipes TaxID=299642 RepID=A0A8X6QH81_NEPPI|nr:ankyrin-3 [Nephila pilipes]
MAPSKSQMANKNLLTSKGYLLPATCSVSNLHEFLTDGNASFLRAARSGNVEKIIEHLKGNIDINTSNANGLNALHLASKEGNVNVVTELLKRGANVNAATKKGNTALHIASLAGQEEVVKVLVQLGANVNVQSQNGFTPLYMAAQENHDSVVSFLLANGANQSLATEDGFTPLAVALQQGHDKVVAVLLENDTKGRVRLPALHIAAKKDDCKAATLLLQSDHNPDVTSKSGFTPLHIAAHYGNENIAKILLSKGADVNYAAKHQITPLHVASKWGKMNMVVLLLENGANIEAATRDGLTPLHCAARSGHDQVVDLLLEKGAPFLAKTKNGLAPLHMASQGDHVDSARILLYHKAPVDDVTVDYLTALHVAAHCGHVKVAKLLLDRKADPNARALNGFTPLHIACKKNRIKVVELLLKHGASIEATTESGLTPLHVASFMGCMNIVIYLIQNGANPDVPTVRGETPLHLAARANQTDIIRILLRNGASVDARAREEQTPLHIAARLGNVDIVSLLLQHGAAVDATTKDMYTALHIAAKEDQEEVASSLLDHGASLTSTTKKGFTPLHLAAKYGNIKVARLLIQKEAPVDAQGKNGVTPLHVAAHYDHVNVALLLLDKGASPHAMAKNGYTPLHIAAKKNQMDIASTLLEYGAKTNSESKAGFTPLHLSSQEGHADMSSLLIENKADVNHKAINGLTPLHLCAQDDRVNVAHILVAHKAEIGPQTKAGYTPLHVASHFGQINMVRFLLQNHANVQTTTSHGYTPLHQAAQQGHTLVVNLLLENQASPNVTTTQGQTPLSIAQRLGYISVVETLKVVTETTVTTTTTTVTEEKYKVVAPETMQETFMTDSEDEGGEEAMLGDQSYGYLTADEMKSLGDDSLPIDVTKDEKHHDIMHSVKQFGAPMVEEDKLSPQHATPVESGFSEKFSPDNIDLARVPVHAGRFSWIDEYYYSSLPKGMLRSRFLVSFMVDARGGAMRGCRHSGVRIIIPPRKASMPMRITCRYLRKEKLIHPPPLMEGEACASRILEMGPVGARFLGPVIIEVPHFASTRGKEREITILRSDTGESWREHVLEASEEAVQEVLNESFEGEELNALEDLNTNRITRILTTDFPQYFAIITRVRQEVHGVGPEGGMVSSTVVPQVQAIFPEGALTKKIRVGLQAQPIAPELVAKLLGNRVAVSPIVTVEPRRRKFHKPITLTIPVPQAATKGMINQYSGDAPTLRLLCSITGSTKSGGSSKAQWEDVTGSTPLTFVNDCVSFTTTVSARFWLMDCRQVNEVTRFATELYQEAVYVPFMSKFVIFAKRYDPYEAQLRVFCMTDDKEDKTLECQENFTEVAKSRDVEVLEGKLQYLEFAGNIAPVTKSGEQLKFPFQAFHENRLPFTIRVKDPHIEAMGRIAFMREPKAGRGEPPQIPICNLNVALPDIIHTDSSADVIELVTLEKRYDFIQEAGLSKPELIHRADLRLSDIAQGLDKDWVLLAQQLDLSENDIAQIKADSTCDQSEQALMMLRLWLQKSGSKATGNELEKGLRKINREDIIKNCMFNVELVTDDVEKAVAKVHLDQSGFDVFKEELGSSREASMRRGASLDISYDEQDIMKEAESAAETSSETGSLFERDQISQALTDDKELISQKDESSKHNTDDVSALFPKCKKSSIQQSEEATPSNSNIHTMDVISNSHVNQPSSFDIIESNDKTVASKKEKDTIVPISQDLRKLHEFWPPDKILINQPNGVHTKPVELISPSPASESKNSVNSQMYFEQSILKEKDINNVPCETLKTNITNEAIFNINNATGTDNSAKMPFNADVLLSKEADKSVDANDLGYCSMDKDSSTSPTFSDNTKLVSLNLVPKDNSQKSKTESLVTSPSQEQNILADNLVLLEQTSILQLLENKNLNQIEPLIVPVDDPVNDIKKNSDSNVTVSAPESINVTSVISNSRADIICTPAVECVTTSTVLSIEQENLKPENSKVEEFDNVDKVKEILLSQSALQDKFKDDILKGSAEVEQKLVDTSGRQEIPARLTESETWPSLELDTSQVSISSLPEDEKSEPTTATVSDAVALAADIDETVEALEEKEPDEDLDDETLSPTKFKDLCSKKVSPTKSVFEGKIMFSPKLPASVQLSSEKILPLQELPLSPVKEVSEIETKETCTSPCSEKLENIKPNQLISTRKGFRTRKRLSPIHDVHKFEPKTPSKIDRGLSPIAVFTAGPSGIEKEANDYLVQTYDAPSMQEPKPQPDNYCSKSTEMSPNTTFGIRQVKESVTALDAQINEHGVPVTKISAGSQFSSSVSSPSKFSIDEKESVILDISTKSNVAIEKSPEENLIKVEKSTSPFSDVMLDTGIGTESPVTADTASSPFLPDIQSPSSLSFQSSSANMMKEHCSTQTIHVEMLSAHTSPIDGPFSLQDSNLSFCPTESSLKSDSLDDLSKTLGTPSSDNVEPDAVLELMHSHQESQKSSVKDFLQEHMSDDTGNLTETDDLPSLTRDHGTRDSSITDEDNNALNKILVIESFRNVFATEPPFSIVSSRKTMKKDADRKKLRKHRVGSETLSTLHDQLLSEESALESSTDSGVDLKETSQSYTYCNIADYSDASSKEDIEDKTQFKTETEVKKTSYIVTVSSSKVEELSKDSENLQDKLDEIEKQILKDTAEYEMSETNTIYAQEILEPSIEQTQKASKIIEGESVLDSGGVTVIEELCVKREISGYTGKDGFDKPKGIVKEEKMKSVISKSQEQPTKFFEEVEQQLICKTALQTFMSPTAEIDSIYAQQIFSDRPNEDNSSYSPKDVKSPISTTASVKEDIIVPQKADYGFSASEQLIAFKETTQTVTLPSVLETRTSNKLISEQSILASKSDQSSIPDTASEDIPRVIQTTQVTETTTVMAVQTPEVQSIEEGCLPVAAPLTSETELTELPHSPELSFAEKRDFFQKLSQSSSSNATPTHTLKGSLGIDDKIETLAADDIYPPESPDEQLSFKECLKFFEKSAESLSPKPEIKDIKKEVWTVVGDETEYEDYRHDSVSDVSDIEKERDMEVVEVFEKRRSTVSIDEQVSLPLHENKEVLEAVFDSTKDAKVEVVVKTFVPGSEMLEICSVENIPQPGDGVSTKSTKVEEIITRTITEVREIVESHIPEEKLIDKSELKTELPSDSLEIISTIETEVVAPPTGVIDDSDKEKLPSNEEFISKTFKTFTESSYEVSRASVGAFKKDTVEKLENKWQRESPDNISIVKDKMEPSLGKSEIFICTEETLDNVKKILSVADAESNVVIRENEPTTSTMSDQIQEIIEKTICIEQMESPTKMISKNVEQYEMKDVKESAENVFSEVRAKLVEPSEKQLKDVEESFEKTAGDFEERKSKLIETQIKDVEESIEKTASDFVETRSKIIEQSEEKIRDVEESVEKAIRDFTEMKSKLTEQSEKQIKVIEESIEKETSGIIEAKSKLIGQSEEKVKDVEKSVEKAISDFTEMKSKLIEQSEKQIKDIEESIEKENRDIIEKKSEIEDQTEEKMRDVEMSIDKAISDFTEMKSKLLEQSEKQIKDVEQSVEKATSDFMETKSKLLEQSEKHIKDVEESIEKLSSEVKEMKSEIVEQTDEKIKEVEESVEKEIKDFTEIKSELVEKSEGQIKGIGVVKISCDVSDVEQSKHKVEDSVEQTEEVITDSKTVTTQVMEEFSERSKDSDKPTDLREIESEIKEAKEIVSSIEIITSDGKMLSEKIEESKISRSVVLEDNKEIEIPYEEKEGSIISVDRRSSSLELLEQSKGDSKEDPYITASEMLSTDDRFVSEMSDERALTDLESKESDHSELSVSRPDQITLILDKTLGSKSVSQDSDQIFDKDIVALKAKIQAEREAGLQFEESLARSVGSNEERSDSCFSSLKDQSVEIEFLPVLEVSEDVSKEAVDKTGHEALGTPCSFHKEMDFEGKHVESEGSFEEMERKKIISEFQLEKHSPSSTGPGTVEKAEYEEVEKKEQGGLEEMIYKKSLICEKSSKETVQSVEVTQFTEHSTEVYSVPSEKLIEKFSSKKIHIESSSDGKDKGYTSHKLEKFLDSVTQQSHEGSIQLPCDVTPVHKRTEEWIDQSGEILLREGELLDSAENGLFEDRPPTLDDEQHKRSSPTAESFDDKARVEQCDTDVMMQLLDFVSRNDIELSEVRTEDEAPDIEEDVSPTAEEEICNRISCEESKTEEKIPTKEIKEKSPECLKVIESENLLLSPQRSSFDSVTSPSRKEAPSETVETVVDMKYHEPNGRNGRMHPQSSLEVEVGSRDSEDAGYYDPDREIVPLSFVEEESLAKVDIKTGKPIESFKTEAPEIKDLKDALQDKQIIESEKPLLSEPEQLSGKMTEIITVTKVVSETTTSERSLPKELEQVVEIQDKIDGTTLRSSSDLTSGDLTGDIENFPEVFSVSEPEQITQDVVQQEIQPEGKTDVIVKEHAQQSFEASVLTEDVIDHELESDANYTSGFVPCAFINTAFAGAELIDKVEQAAPIRARSPYEVIRGDQSDTSEQEIPPSEESKDLSSSITRTTYITKHTEMRHRPMLQNIPSEISEEDLVEREIGSPVLRLEAFGFPDHAETRTQENVSTETTTSDSGTVTKTTVITRVTTRTTVLQDEFSGEDEGTVEKYSQLEMTEGDVSEGISKREEIEALESSDVDHRSGTSILETLPKREGEEKYGDSIITTTITKTVTEKTVSGNGNMKEPQASLPSPIKQADETIESFEAFEGTRAEQILNGPGEVDYHQEYDYCDEYPQNKWSTEQYGYADPSYSDSPFKESLASNEMRKSRYSSVSDDVVDYEIGEIFKSEQQFDDIIERPMTPEPPVDEYSDTGIVDKGLLAKAEVAGLALSEYELKEKDDSLFEEGEPISSPALSPDDSRSGFAYGMQFEKDVLDVAEEAMDIDSDPYSEEKEPAYAYGMRYERDAGLEDEDVPCYGDLYTHEEEDEDALENGDKVKIVLKPKKEPEFDILAGRKYFSKNVEIDELSVSSLQEFEHLEAEIVSGRKSSIGSLDSLNDKPPNGKGTDHDDVSMSSLTEFERLERECLEVEKIDPAMQESITQLSEIEEGHESQASETSQENKSDGCKDEDLSIIEDYDHHLGDIDNIILKVDSESKNELPFQYLLKQVPKSSDTFKGEMAKDGDKAAEVVRKSDFKTEHASSTFTSDSCMLISQQSQEHLTKSNGKSDDIDQDSLRDEISLKPDSLAEDPRHEYLDSLHEGKCDDDDSLQGDIPDEMRDSLLEERHMEDDSLHDMDILPDESSLSMESSFAAAISRDSSKADDHIKAKKPDSAVVRPTLESSSITTSSKDEKIEIIVSELPKYDIMLSSTDSLEQSSSAAAAFHFESESAMSTSLTGALASEDNTMISSTDTLEHEGRITFRYEDIPVDDLEILVKDGRKVIVDSEGNIQTEYDMKHFLESEDNLNNDFNLSSKTFTEIKLPSTSTVQVQSAVTSISYTGEPDDIRTKIHQSITDGREKESKFESTYSDPDVEIEEIHTTDEYGNPKVIKKVKKVITTKTQFSSSSSSENVEEKLKEFLRERAAGDKAGLGEEVVQEERSIDDKGNVLLVRTVQQQILSEPEVHSRTFTGPRAAALSEEYIKQFKDSEPTDDICEYEKIDDEGNVVRVTQQVVIRPEVHSVSFSGPNAQQQMEEYMRRFTSMSQNGDARESSQSFSTVQVTTTTTEQDLEGVPSESGSHDVSGMQCIQTTTSSFTPESSEQIVHTTTTTCTSFSSTDDTAQPGATTHHASSS